MKISSNARKAIYLGTLCSLAYFSVYIARNALSAATPQMLAAGYTESYIGSVSSLFFVFYAIGQLINGWIGDHIKAKWMISGGLIFAAISNASFPYLGEYPTLAMLIFSLSGFFLSMIYGPMTKVVSENTEPLHAVRCSLGYTFAAFFGSPAAGIIASLFIWQSVFTLSSASMLIMAAAVILCFFIFERRGLVKYGQYKPQEKGAKNIKMLFKLQIVKFSFVAILTGIVRTSVVFWLPTYIAQYLSFTETQATAIFTVCTLVISFTAFIAVFIYDVFGRNMQKTLLLMFVVSAVTLLLTYFVHQPILNIIFLVLAIMGANGASTMIWSCYCPSLRDTGMVSSVTGFLDFLSYMAAAIANIVFANAVTAIGWGNLILVWFGLVSLGIIVAWPFKKKNNAV
jgi:sugar phosphate permease